MLLGDFSIADAFYAPVCIRLLTYQITVPKVIEDYVERVIRLSAVVEWVNDVLNEHDFFAFEEPYRLKGN